MSSVRLLVVLVVASGCGRIRFDANATRPGDGGGSDAGGFSGALTWAPNGGEIGGALSFPGDGSALLIGMPPAFANLGALTVIAWLDLATGAGACIFDHGDPTLGWAVQTSDDGTGTHDDDSTVAVSLGCNSNPGFEGLLDDVQIYGRVLSPAEIAALSN